VRMDPDTPPSSPAAGAGQEPASPLPAALPRGTPRCRAPWGIPGGWHWGGGHMQPPPPGQGLGAGQPGVALEGGGLRIGLPPSSGLCRTPFAVPRAVGARCWMGTGVAVPGTLLRHAEGQAGAGGSRAAGVRRDFSSASRRLQMELLASPRNLSPSALGALPLTSRMDPRVLAGGAGSHRAPQRRVPPLSPNPARGSLNLWGFGGARISLPWPKRRPPWGAREKPGRDRVGCPWFCSPRRGPAALGICSTHHSARVGGGRMCPICFTGHLSVGFFCGKQSQRAALRLEIPGLVGRGMPGLVWAGVLPAWVLWVQAPGGCSSWGTPRQEPPVDVMPSDAAVPRSGRSPSLGIPMGRTGWWDGGSASLGTDGAHRGPLRSGQPGEPGAALHQGEAGRGVRLHLPDADPDPEEGWGEHPDAGGPAAPPRGGPGRQQGPGLAVRKVSPAPDKGGDRDPRRVLPVSPLPSSPFPPWGDARPQLPFLPFQIVGFEQDLLQVGCPHHRERHDREGECPQRAPPRGIGPRKTGG